MTAQDIFKAIISDDNITLVESVNTVLYEKSNMLLEDMRIYVGQSIISEMGDADYKNYGNAKKSDNDARIARNNYNSELDALHTETRKKMRDNTTDTHEYRENQKLARRDRYAKLDNMSPTDRSDNAKKLERRAKNISDTPQSAERMDKLNAKTYQFNKNQRDAGQQNPKSVNSSDMLRSAQMKRNDSRSNIKL